MASAFAFSSISNLLLFSLFSAAALDIDIGIGIGGGGYTPPPSDSPNCNTPPPPPGPPKIAPGTVQKPPPPPPPQPPPKISPPPPVPRKIPPPATAPKSPPPPPPKIRVPPKSPPPPSTSSRIQIAFRAIKKYKARIEKDPLNIKATWKGNDVCNYTGFKCDKVPDFKQRAVSGVSFNNFNFSGSKLSLDGLLDELPDVTFFHANSNFFFNTIPKLTSRTVKFFYELDLSNNKFFGPFPKQVLAAVNLTFLDLRFNKYYGPVYPELFDMDIITAIFLNNNNFNQCIPSNLGNTPARYLTFTSNQFIGSIPRSIGTGKTKNSLIEVLFSNNKLSGCLPMEIGLLQNTILFDASKNYLTGPIPYSFGCLAKMELLNFADNYLYGAVPDILCELPNLQNLTLRNNFFTQVDSSCRDSISKKILDVSGNCIFGLPNQRSKQECTKFFSNRHDLCSVDKSMKYIPPSCKGKKYLYDHQPAVGRHPPPRKLSEMRTYAALAPH